MSLIVHSLLELMSRIASHAQRFKELVGSDAEPETMEEKITLALGSVLP